MKLSVLWRVMCERATTDRGTIGQNIWHTIAQHLITRFSHVGTIPENITKVGWVLGILQTLLRCERYMNRAHRNTIYREVILLAVQICGYHAHMNPNGSRRSRFRCRVTDKYVDTSLKNYRWEEGNYTRSVDTELEDQRRIKIGHHTTRKKWLLDQHSAPNHAPMWNTGA